MDRYIKLWDGIASEWRYAKEPKHFRIYVQCLLEAWHADAKEYKRGTFRTSKRILADKTGYSIKTIERVLSDLSSGEEPEITIKTNKGYSVGYTEITILNYDKYQGNTSHSPSNTSHSLSNTSVVPSNTSVVPSNASQGRTKEESIISKHNVYTPCVVEELFIDDLSRYPKPLNDFDIKIFNALGLDDKKLIANFASSMGKLWETHNGQKDVSKVTKLETVIKYHLQNPRYITSSDVTEKVLKIKYEKKFRTPTYQEMVASGKIKV